MYKPIKIIVTYSIGSPNLSLWWTVHSFFLLSTLDFILIGKATRHLVHTQVSLRSQSRLGTLFSRSDCNLVSER